MKRVEIQLELEEREILKPGQAIKVDYEYERKGTRNLFVAVEPLAGWRTFK